jgi:hypothetical protein
VWRRLQGLVQDVNPDGAVWLADIIMGVVKFDFGDKLGECRSFGRPIRRSVLI